MSDYDGTENPETPWRGDEDGASEHDGRGDEELTGRDRTPHEPNPDERGTWLAALVGLLGLALLVEAVVLDLAASQFWNDVFVGATLFLAGAYNYYSRSNREFGSLGVASLVALLGLWLVAAPFLLGTGSGATETASDVGFWTDIVVGLLAFGLGTYSAYAIRDRRRRADVRGTAT
ncbi:SPW repeat protein [Natrinema amylolyticum]|uniref:SPW repeat protein n=1 Tax=Natrinema amylolyticum TaxID=2878679 RepID=UPI001CFB2AE3|nr:SPW repeat protein [Natrinema amylolyticum]